MSVGTQIADYRLEELVGRGGMSVVYRAHDLALERPVALKLLSPTLAEDPAFRPCPAAEREILKKSSGLLREGERDPVNLGADTGRPVLDLSRRHVLTAPV